MWMPHSTAAPTQNSEQRPVATQTSSGTASPSLSIAAPHSKPIAHTPKSPTEKVNSAPTEEARANVQDDPAPTTPAAIPKPAAEYEALWRQSSGVRIVTFPILPGQELNVSDPEFNFIKVETDYPVLVKIGHCQATNTLRIRCKNVPDGALILVQDSRIGISPDEVPRNKIRITAVK